MMTIEPLGAEPRRTDPRSAPNGTVARAAAPSRAEPLGVTLAQAAEQLGISVDALRRRMKAAGVSGQMTTAPHGGRQRRLGADDLAVLSSAPFSAEPRASDNGSAPNRAEPRAAAPSGDLAEGWRAALAEVTADRDRLRSDLATARVAHQEALRRAEGAETALRSAESRADRMRGAWFAWRALLAELPLWRRVRRRWPEPPAELVADRLLANPK